MMSKNNTYFENLKRIGHDWEAARVERQARKQQIIDTLGWDSDELKAWYEEDAAAKFPFESGVSQQGLPRMGTEPFPQGGRAGDGRLPLGQGGRGLH